MEVGESLNHVLRVGFEHILEKANEWKVQHVRIPGLLCTELGQGHRYRFGTWWLKDTKVEIVRDLKTKCWYHPPPVLVCITWTRQFGQLWKEEEDTTRFTPHHGGAIAHCTYNEAFAFAILLQLFWTTDVQTEWCFQTIFLSLWNLGSPNWDVL